MTAISDIYRRQVALTQAGERITGRSKKLYINYRTTDEIRQYAVALLHGTAVDDLDGGKDDNKKYKSLMHGLPAPPCSNFARRLLP